MPGGAAAWESVATSGTAYIQAHVPKNDIETHHKVVHFGNLDGANSKYRDEAEAYQYLHQRADLKVSRGSIPVDFLSKLSLQEGQPIYLATRRGDDRPEYQVTWKAEREVIMGANSNVDGWSDNLDELWTAVLSHFDRKNLLSEDTLEYLDADPFVLFGIDDPVTQQALKKLTMFPALMCDGPSPVFEEWAGYLRIQPTDSKLKWMVQAFSETDLPKPWTCYKGVGSIVCYIRSDTGQVTWKHPFYDYFRQLKDFCEQARMEEVMQVRCNRLLWSYEATRVETEHDQEPLISPEYISRMADIFGYDVKKEGFLVRNIKAQLKVFARSYRETQDIDLSEVVTCAEILQQDREKYHEMVDHWQGKGKEELQFDLDQLSAGELRCVNCGTTALCFCLECKDYLCLGCYDSLHTRGARLDHSPFRLVSCAFCVTMPAKLHCTFTDKSLCHKCYAMEHIKMLPPDGKENQPRRIDYMQQYTRYAQLAQENMERETVPALNLNAIEDYDSVLSTDWHPFYDSRGVKYYHNFTTGERMRQSPRRVPNTSDAEALPPEPEQLTLMNATNASLRSSNTASSGMDAAARTGNEFSPLKSGTGFAKSQPLALHGFDALQTDPPAHMEAAANPQLRTLRAPHRVHMPVNSPTY